MATKTPEELAKHKQRIKLKEAINRVSSQWGFSRGELTWETVYELVGKPASGQAQSGRIGDYKILKAFLADLTEKFEAKLNGLTKLVIPIQVSPTIAILPPDPVAHRAFLGVSEPAEEGFVNTDDYGLPVNPNHSAFLFWFQKKAVKEILDGFLGFDTSQCKDIVALRQHFSTHLHLANSKRGMLLLAATGTGKTFMAGAVMRYLYDIGFTDGLCYGPTHYLYVTRATIVEQTKRVFQNIFKLGIKQNVEILNIEQLRSKAGGLWVDRQHVIVNGQEDEKWTWRPFISPTVIFWDESQSLKNECTTQHNIASSYNEIPANTWQLFISATPFTRVCEAKCFCVATRKPLTGILGDSHPLSNTNWPMFASEIAGLKGDPKDYNEAAIERLTKDLDVYIVRVRGVRPQFDAQNRIEMIWFENKEEEKFYNDAWERYQEELRKLQAAGINKEGATGESRFQILVKFLKFRMAAEYCRRYQLAKRMHEAVVTGKKAAVAALNFKGTIIAITRILVEEYGVPRDQISLIWGGGQTALTKKQKNKKLIQEQATALAAAGMDMTQMLGLLDLDEVEDRELQELPEHLKLGTQSKDDRQKEIDRFQSGRSLYCLYSFRAGGVGLSLHHTDEMVKQKCRRQKNGYVVVEDIPNIPVRPRVNFVAPTYSAIELVQGLGRCPRLTSLSDTEQILIFYRGTIEQDVATVVSQKLRCLSRVVRQRESWNDIVVGGVNADSHLDKNLREEKGTNYDDLSADEDDEE